MASKAERFARGAKERIYATAIRQDPLSSINLASVFDWRHILRDGNGMVLAHTEWAASDVPARVVKRPERPTVICYNKQGASDLVKSLEGDLAAWEATEPSEG